MISAYTHGIGSNFPGQSPRKCGHASQVAEWGSHSAGMRKLVAWGNETGCRMNSVNHPAGNCAVAINPPVAQKRPVTPDIFKRLQIHFRHQNFLFILRSLRDDATERIRNERSAPEFQALARSLLAANVSVFKADAIHHRNVNPIGDCMGALNRLPRIMLRHSELFFLRRMPADRSRIKQYLRPLQRGQPRALRIPLVPAHQRADPSNLSVERSVAKIARSKVVLLVIERVVRNMHLAINSPQAAISVN